MIEMVVLILLFRLFSDGFLLCDHGLDFFRSTYVRIQSLKIKNQLFAQFDIIISRTTENLQPVRTYALLLKLLLASIILRTTGFLFVSPEGVL